MRDALDVIHAVHAKQDLSALELGLQVANDGLANTECSALNEARPFLHLNVLGVERLDKAVRLNAHGERADAALGSAQRHSLSNTSNQRVRGELRDRQHWHGRTSLEQVAPTMRVQADWKWRL